MTVIEKSRVLNWAKTIGMRAPVETVPDFTEEGLEFWKEDLLTYFGCAADNLMTEVKAGEELRPEIHSAMKAGFKELILTQPYVDVPLNPMEPPPRGAELRILDSVFDELPSHPHHCAR